MFIVLRLTKLIGLFIIEYTVTVADTWAISTSLIRAGTVDTRPIAHQFLLFTTLVIFWSHQFRWLHQTVIYSRCWLHCIRLRCLVDRLWIGVDDWIFLVIGSYLLLRLVFKIISLTHLTTEVIILSSSWIMIMLMMMQMMVECVSFFD